MIPRGGALMIPSGGTWTCQKQRDGRLAIPRGGSCARFLPSPVLFPITSSAPPRPEEECAFTQQALCMYVCMYVCLM
jgi:hypothetical protein